VCLPSRCTLLFVCCVGGIFGVQNRIWYCKIRQGLIRWSPRPRFLFGNFGIVSSHARQNVAPQVIRIVILGDGSSGVTQQESRRCRSNVPDPLLNFSIQLFTLVLLRPYQESCNLLGGAHLCRQVRRQLEWIRSAGTPPLLKLRR
jgi:hypothetical protein